MLLANTTLERATKFLLEKKIKHTKAQGIKGNLHLTLPIKEHCWKMNEVYDN